MKQRLDTALVERGLASGRDKAKALIMAGQVYCNGQKADKVGEEIREEDALEVRGDTLPYVSRGGLKLEKAIKNFGLRLENKVCCDFGASTGGFTDCMLQNGAVKVYAFDVGYGQLAWSLRQDPRVINRERTNVRHITRQDVEPIDFVSADLSFISLKLIFPAIMDVLKEGGEALCLVKPQFEAGRDKVGKKGVVKDPSVHREVLNTVLCLARQEGFWVAGLDFSPIKGPEGNIEYLLYLTKGGIRDVEPDVSAIVEASHKNLVV